MKFLKIFNFYSKNQKYKVKLINFLKTCDNIMFCSVFSMIIGQEHSLKPKSLREYSFVHCINLISRTSPQFRTIINHIGLFVKI